MEYKDGSVYEGQWENDKRHSEETKNIYTWPNGTTYKGAFNNDKFHGQGAINTPETANFEGKFENGLKKGYGTMTYEDGSVYMGEWKDGMRHDSKGEMTWEEKDNENSSYIGSFEKDKRTGEGIYLWSKNPAYEYKGSWLNGLRHGKGTQKYGDGSSYVGMWVEDNRHGKGIYKYKDGSKYEGEWVNDIK